MALLIGGHQRSGTSMLWDVCNLHPEITLTRELASFSLLNHPYPDYRNFILRRWKGFLGNPRLRPLSGHKQPLRWLNLARNHAFMARYLWYLSRQRIPVDAAAVEETLQALFPHTRIVGDKYPDYVFQLDTLTTIDSLACLIIYRNCFDVASSTLHMVRTRWRTLPWSTHVDTAEKVARRWVQAIAIMERYADRLHIVRYEDLVQGPAKILAGLGTWLGVDAAGFDPQHIRADRIGGHSSGLTQHERGTVMDIAGPTLARLGYL